MTQQVMVYYVDEDSVEQTKEIMLDVENKIGFEMPGYRHRIVTDQNALREKAIIFEHGLDDRIIEIIKLLYYTNANKQFPEVNITAIYFFMAEDKFILQFIGDSPLSVEIPIEMYEKIKNDFTKQLEAAGDKEALINIDWALDLIKGQHD